MPLPILEQKYYRTKLFSTDQEVSFRPFTIGQQRDLLIIRDTAQDDIQIYGAIVDMIQDCVKDIKIKDLYVMEFEKLFYDIRSVADGNIINFHLTCPDEKCKNENEFEVNSQTDFIITNKNFKGKVKIDDTDLIINLRQHKIRDLFILENKKYNSDEEKALDSIMYCIESIVEGKNLISEFTHDEIIKFVDSLPSTYLEKISKFYADAPNLKCTKKFKCAKCNKEIEIKSSEMKLFF